MIPRLRLRGPQAVHGKRRRTADRGPVSAASMPDLAQALEGLLAGESDWIANTSNTAASIFHSLPALNWVGFYFLQGNELVLGPFQGKPACVRIPLGQGVCGTAAAQRRTIRVADVQAFPGHIACDMASRSELVVPLLHGGRVLGVLDLDSPIPDRFDETDQEGCETLVRILLRHAVP